MPKVNMSTPLAANADNLWQAIGGFGAIADWHPAIEKADLTGETKGSVRTLHLVGGGTITERLEEVSASERVYRYSITDSPLPISNYVAEIKVNDNGDGTSTVEWSSEFEAKGVGDNEALTTIQGIYQAGFDNLAKLYGMKK